MPSLRRAGNPSYGLWGFFVILAATIALGAYIRVSRFNLLRERVAFGVASQMLSVHLVEVKGSTEMVANRPASSKAIRTQSSMGDIVESVHLALRSKDGARVSHQRVGLALRDEEGYSWSYEVQWVGDDLYIFIVDMHDKRPKGLDLTVVNGREIIGKMKLPVLFGPPPPPNPAWVSKPWPGLTATYSDKAYGPYHCEFVVRSLLPPDEMISVLVMGTSVARTRHTPFPYRSDPTKNGAATVHIFDPPILGGAAARFLILRVNELNIREKILRTTMIRVPIRRC